MIAAITAIFPRSFTISHPSSSTKSGRYLDRIVRHGLGRGQFGPTKADLCPMAKAPPESLGGAQGRERRSFGIGRRERDVRTAGYLGSVTPAWS